MTMMLDQMIDQNNFQGTMLRYRISRNAFQSAQMQRPLWDVLRNGVSYHRIYMESYTYRSEMAKIAKTKRMK